MNNIETKRTIKNNKKTQSEPKNKQGNKNISINILHENKMKYFNNLYEIILPQKENELQLLLTNNNVNRSEIDSLKNEIKNIKNKTEENEYYLNNMSLLQEYFIYLETEESKINSKVFGKKQVKSTKEKDFLDKYNDINNIKIEEISDKKIDSRRRRNKNSIDNLNIDTICNNCHLFDTIICSKEDYVCIQCGVIQGKIFSNTLSYNDRSTTGNNNDTIDYKRFNYFKEILLQIQGNELTDIPEDIFDKIIFELDKENFTNLSLLTIDKIKLLLKKTGNSKWYEHASLIISRITNQPTIKIPFDIQEKLYYMFKKIDADFDKYKFRANFFSFPYIIHKMFELLQLQQNYSYFPNLNNIEKLHLQDVMWKHVLDGFFEKDLNNDIDNRFLINWRFIKST
jgi:hypothetical protein